MKIFCRCNQGDLMNMLCLEEMHTNGDWFLETTCNITRLMNAFIGKITPCSFTISYLNCCFYQACVYSWHPWFLLMQYAHMSNVRKSNENVYLFIYFSICTHPSFSWIHNSLQGHRRAEPALWQETNHRGTSKRENEGSRNAAWM